MALFGPSSKELAQREREVERKYSEIKELLQNQQGVIAERFQDLGNIDAAIMTKTNLEMIYQEQVAALDAQKQSLADAIASYHAASSQFADKTQELSVREQSIIARECEASASFAAKLDEQLKPLNDFKASLEEKEQRIIMMQEEFNKNFVLQDQKLLADFQRLRASLQASFDERQQKALAEREELEKKMNALNEREGVLQRREAEVREGLAGERAQMLASMQGERERLAGAEGQLAARRDCLDAREREIERKEADLAQRLAAVQSRENEAAADFARQKQSMLAEVQSARDAAAAAALQMQQQASEQCDRMLLEWGAQLDGERRRMMAGLSAETQRQREENEAAAAALRQQQSELQSRQRELEKRDGALQLREASLDSREELLAGREEILNGKFQRIAEERIAAAQAEAHAAVESRNELSRKLASLMMECEAIKSMRQGAPEPENADSAPSAGEDA